MQKVVSAAITFLLLHQKKNGSFLSFTTISENFTHAKPQYTTFITSLILAALSPIKTEDSEQVKKKAKAFLLTQMNEYGALNYWQRNSQESKQTPYPDDLDDTFCGLYALTLYDKKLIDGTLLANVVSLLTHTEVSVGGPYTTWIVGKNAPVVWKDIDIAVNSNIAYFLFLNDITVPQLQKYIEKEIKNGKLFSPYYVSEITIIYFLSRFYNGTYKQHLIERLLTKRTPNGHWKNPLETALALSALLHFDAHSKAVEPAINYLLQQQKNGIWKAYPFVNERIKKDGIEYSGAAELTTALCVEALKRYEKRKLEEEEKKLIDKRHEVYEKIYQKISDEVLLKLHDLPHPLNSYAKALLDRLIIKDKQKIIPLTPYHFYETLEENDRQKITEDMLIYLGTANTLGWLAFTILDDYFDKDLSDPLYLSIVSWCLTELTLIFATILPAQSGFINEFRSIMHAIDKANTEELLTLHIQKNEERILYLSQIPKNIAIDLLVNKSLGHCLGPVAIYYLLGYQKNAKALKDLKNFYYHFIITKQLSDDAHDWQKDLLEGRLTIVNIMVLQEWQKKHPHAKTINLTLKLQQLSEIFWYRTIHDINDLMYKHIQKAKKYARVLPIENPEPLLILLAPFENAIHLSEVECEKMKQFLKKYKE